jgi:DNA repair exonuclease SbcCD ATPase subunit
MAGKAADYGEQLRKLEREFEEMQGFDGKQGDLMRKLRTLESLLAGLMVNVSYSTGTTEGVLNPNQILVQCRLLARRIESKKAQSCKQSETGEEGTREWEEFGQRLEKVQKQLERLSDLLEQARNETAHYKSLSADLQSQLKDQSDLFSTQSLALQESQSLAKSLSDQLLEQQSHISRLEASISTLNQQNNHSETTISELKSTMDKLQQAFQGEIGRIKERFDTELEQARVMWDKQTTKISELSPCYLDLRKKLETEIGVNKDLHSRLSSEVHDSIQLREECQRFQHRIDHLTAQLAAKTQDMHLMDLALTQAVQSEQVSVREVERDDGRVRELEAEVNRLKSLLGTAGRVEEEGKEGNIEPDERMEEMERWVEAVKSEK